MEGLILSLLEMHVNVENKIWRDFDSALNIGSSFFLTDVIMRDLKNFLFDYIGLKIWGQS